jgi:uncharacterized membrane protein YvlD (DUF360 family)
MADRSQQAGAPTKHVHHGRTPAAWAGSMMAMVAFIVGGVALILQIWPLFWAAAVLLIAALVVTKVLQTMGHGAY